MRLAVIGTGMIAQYMMKAWADLPGLQLCAVCSRSKEQAKQFADSYGISKAYSNYDELLADENIDTIYIALPNHLHFSYAKKALLSYKNVIVEKPFTSNAYECAELIELTKQQNIFLWEAITTLHLPVFKQLQNLLPQIGKPRLVQMSYCKTSRHYDAMLRGEFTNTFSIESSGGALMDLNIYNLHMAIGLLGSPVESVYYANIADNGIDTSGSAILRYGDTLCVCTAAKDTNGPMFTAIQGTKGSLYLDSLAIQSYKVHIAVGNEEVECVLGNTLDGHVYQMNEFLRQFQERDFTACERLLKHTQNVMNEVTALRKSAGIIFPADKLPS